MHSGLDRRSVLGLSAAGLLGVALAGAADAHGVPNYPAAPSEPLPEKLMFIRHAEDPSGPGQPFGVTDAGVVDSQRSLTVRGWTRAGALVTLFDPRGLEGNPIPPRLQIHRPVTVFAHNPGTSDSRRSLETVTPLAAALNLEVGIRFTHTETAELAAALTTVRLPALIAWRHEEIFEIISHLGVVTPEPPKSWPEHRYDMVYVLTREGSGWRFAQVPQMLLAGDQSALIV